jgi:hypothetical protein
VTVRGNETLRRTLTTPGYPASTPLMILRPVLPLPLRRTEAIDGLSRHATWATTPTVTAERIHTARRADAGRQASHELAPADILANNTAVDVVHRVTSCRTHPGSRVPVNGVWVASVAKHRSSSSRTRNQLCNGVRRRRSRPEARPGTPRSNRRTSELRAPVESSSRIRPGGTNRRAGRQHVTAAKAERLRSVAWWCGISCLTWRVSCAGSTPRLASSASPPPRA